MTVTYSLDVAKARFCGFPKLLSRWKGGIYKILWREFLIFCCLYGLLSFTYRRILDEEQKVIFEKVVIFVETFTDLIPLSFVLGFYVSLVIGRWWGQYETIPWPDRLCFLISTYVHGSDERSRMIRRTLGRYVILAQALTFQAVSTSVKRRFPTSQHLVAAGIMTKGEQSVLEKVSFPYGKWWLPCHWFCALATRAKKEGRIKDSVLLNGLLKEMLDFRTFCAIMFGYDWISVPLVYTQVVTIATYLYSLALIVGRQYLDPAKGYHGHDIDLYIPLFSLLQFFFYMGWLKVAEQILNPYGEDDDDFELNWCIDRTVHIVYLTVDNLQLKHPKVCKDYFWDDIEPILPQTKHSAKFFIHPQLGSACSLDVEDAEYIPVDALFEQDVEENNYTSNSIKRNGDHRPSLIRRLLSSGSNQSRRRRPTYRENHRNHHPGSQGYINPAFDSSSEKNLLKDSAKSLNNASESAHGNNRASGGLSFRPNSFTLSRRKTYHLQDAERLNRQTLSLSPPGPNVQPVGRTVSAPPSHGVLPDIDDDLEGDMEEDEEVLEGSMPVIPEESASRAASMGDIGVGKFDPENRIQRPESVLKNVQQGAECSLKSLQSPENSLNGLQRSENFMKSLQSSDRSLKSLQSPDNALNSLQRPENVFNSFQGPEISLNGLQRTENVLRSLHGSDSSLRSLQSADNSLQRPENVLKSLQVPEGSFKTHQTPEDALKNVQNLVQEAREALRDLDRAISVEEGREQKGYESCCSVGGSSSDELLLEDSRKEVSVVVDLGIEKDQVKLFQQGSGGEGRIDDPKTLFEMMEKGERSNIN